MFRHVLAMAALTATGWHAAFAATVSAPVVVELFTSQGCSSCPPADAYLGELAKRKDIIALSLHVDYWNRLGWTDPFSLPETTRRQSDYAAALRTNHVYTPQVVVDGAAHAVGSRKPEVEALITSARGVRKLNVEVRDSADGVAVTIPGGEGAPASVWMALFDAQQTTRIATGENGGRALAYHNVVRRLAKIGEWKGAAVRLAAPVGEAERRERAGCVVIVQEGHAGPVLGAALLRFDRAGN
jgi:hypothetical protein